MEIDPDGKNLPIVSAVRDINTEKPSSSRFGEMLDEFMAAPTKAETQDYETAFIESNSDIQRNNTRPKGGNPVIGRAEQVLDILAEYQRKLADPAFTLKDMSSLVRQLETCNRGLVPELDALSDGDGLKDILSQVIIVSTLEVIRFNRGDYVNP